MGLAPHAYRVLVSGVVHGEDEVSPNDMLALDSGLVHASVSGRAVKDPTFGLEALWIPAEQKDQAVASSSEEPTSELQSLMRISYAVFCLKKKKNHKPKPTQS